MSSEVICIGSDSESDDTFTRITRSRKKGVAKKSEITDFFDLTETNTEISKKKTLIIDDDLNISIDDDSDYELEENIRVVWTQNVNEIKRFILKPSETLCSVFDYFSQKYKVPIENIHIRNKDKIVSMYDTVKSLNLKVTEILEAYAVDNADSCMVNNPNKIEIKCLFQSSKKPLLFYLYPNQKLHTLVDLCAKEANCSSDRIELKFDGERISPQDSPLSLELEEGECLEVHLL